MNRIQCLLALSGGLLCLGPAPAAAAPSLTQTDCTTNYCIKSQATSYQTPPGWPAVTVQPCCKTDWGSRSGSIDWPNGAPIMICTGNAEYATTYPNCGDPKNLSQAFPLAYENPRIGIGVAWPNAKDYRYEMQSVPIVDGPDGTCAQFSHQPGKIANWWVYQLKEPKTGSYVFTATVAFQQGETGFHAVLSNCTLAPPSSPSAGQ